MESDDEVRNTKGASYDFGARMLDPRIGRWFAVDRHSKPWKSNYQFATNNPIVVIDPDGNDDYYCNAKGQVVAIVETEFAPRFYQLVETEVSNNGGASISVISPKQFSPTADEIVRANYGLNDYTMVGIIANDYQSSSDLETASEIRHKNAVTTIAKGQAKYHGVAVGLGTLILTATGAGLLEGAGAVGIELLVKEGTEEVVEQVTGVPLDLTKVVVNGIEKIGKTGAKKLAKDYAKSYKSLSLKNIKNKFAKGAEGIQSANGKKTIYKNSTTNNSIVVDNKTGNFRIKNEAGHHLDESGGVVNAPSGVTGSDARDYVQSKTHFKNSDTK